MAMAAPVCFVLFLSCFVLFCFVLFCFVCLFCLFWTNFPSWDQNFFLFLFLIFLSTQVWNPQ